MNQWNKKLVHWKNKQDWHTSSQLTKEERRRLELMKSEMKKGTLQQMPMKFNWSYGNTIKNLYSCKLENEEEID
jgi:plasmid maintenance system killer protein